MLAFPAAIPLTIPLAVPTLAIVALLLLHTPPIGVAESVLLVEVHIVAIPEITGKAFMVTSLVI